MLTRYGAIKGDILYLQIDDVSGGSDMYFNANRSCSLNAYKRKERVVNSSQGN